MSTSRALRLFTAIGLAAGLPILLASAEAQSTPQRSADSSYKPSSVSHDDLDRRIFDQIVKVLDEGAEVNNKELYGQGPAKCTYLFKGTLDAAEAMLVHRPDLQDSIRKGISRAMHPKEKWPAFELRNVLIQVKTTLDPDRDWPKVGPLWERIGGAPNVKQVVDYWIDAAIDDPNVNFTRDKTYALTPERVADIKSKIIELASAVMGGPEKVYKHKTMKEAHLGMAITEREFDAMTRHLQIGMLRKKIRPEEIKEVMGILSIIRNDITGKLQPKPDETGTLWERLGKEKKVAKIVHEFVALAIKDPKVNFSRDGKFAMNPKSVAELEAHIVNMASSFGGGPFKYEGKSMRDVHKSMNITDGEFNALLTNLRIVLIGNQVSLKDIELVIARINEMRVDIVKAR